MRSVDIVGGVAVQITAALLTPISSQSVMYYWTRGLYISIHMMSACCKKPFPLFLLRNLPNKLVSGLNFSQLSFYFTSGSLWISSLIGYSSSYFCISLLANELLTMQIGYSVFQTLPYHHKTWIRPRSIYILCGTLSLWTQAYCKTTIPLCLLIQSTKQWLSLI